MTEEHEKEHHHKESHGGKVVNIKKSTLKLVVFVIIALVAGFGIGVALSGSSLSGSSIKSVDKNAVGQKAVKYLNDNLVQAGTTATFVSVSEENGLYKITTSYQGNQIDVYSTSDGSLLFTSQPVSMDKATTTTDTTQPEPTPTPITAQKSDKPVVELFVMSHCPYGTQAEKGILPAVRALGDKIDFKIKFVYYAMHGETEVKEQMSQYCIQKEQPSKYLSYLACFLNASDSTGCIASTGVDTAKLSACKTTADAQFEITKNFNDQSSWLSGRFPKFNTDLAANQQYGVGGSPTLIINGAQSNAGRDSASYLRAICAAFNTPPAECNTQLSSTPPGPGFGYDSVGAAQAAGCGV